MVQKIPFDQEGVMMLGLVVWQYGETMLEAFPQSLHYSPYVDMLSST